VKKKGKQNFSCGHRGGLDQHTERREDSRRQRPSKFPSKAQREIKKLSFRGTKRVGHMRANISRLKKKKGGFEQDRARGLWTSASDSLGLIYTGEKRKRNADKAGVSSVPGWRSINMIKRSYPKIRKKKKP